MTKVTRRILRAGRDSLIHLIDLFYPRVCLLCGTPLVRGENVLCLHCLNDLPRTYYSRLAENPVERIFAGKIRFRFASAFLFFQKKGKGQRLIHALKYHGNRKVGFLLGQIAATDLQSNHHPLADVDCIIPVPLHRKRLRQRGYNQSAVIAEGMSSVLHVPVDTTHLVRHVNNVSQTGVSHQDRWGNVNRIFSVLNPDELAGKHVLLIDDVVTTGSTLCACAETLQSVPDIGISIFAMATASSY